MSRPDVLHDLAAEHVAQVSHDLVRGLQKLAPRQPMTDADRRANLLGLAEIVVRESDWGVPPVVTPALRPLVRYWSTAVDPMPAMGRLLLAVQSCNGRDADKALDRLVVAVAA